ncbi:4-oxalocrotonate tautomerase [Bacillus cereus group sp. BfR-BA-01380]|uniref:4-oxalocrotonate tautomerase n=1 Tax=Bacillus cereus group sp. BfR-BA-01380 TaxID=2920324 RepID=UPI001F5641FE|nr:4-oxalocrotonate tautomerase [Bacillus cereus group sp. BfR-BA-01380]
MPIVQIQILQGREQKQIQHLIMNVTDAVAKSLEVDIERVRILVTEIPDTHWGVGGKLKSGVEEY